MAKFRAIEDFVSFSFEVAGKHEPSGLRNEYPYYQICVMYIHVVHVKFGFPLPSDELEISNSFCRTPALECGIRRENALPKGRIGDVIEIKS